MQKEVTMRLHVTIAMLGCALSGVMLLSSPAAANWHSPNIYRNTSGTWTDIEYDDGVCHYKYSHNAYDNETHVNRSGDCSRVAIGPSGVPAPIYDAVPYPGED
jgi:hypothetical protein